MQYICGNNTLLNKTAHLKRFLFFIVLFFLPSVGGVGGGCLFAQKQGQDLVDSLVKELPKAKEDTNKINILNQLSYNMYSSDADSGIKYGQQALELAQKLNWKKGIALANNELGVNYLTISDYAKALEYFLTSLNLNEELHDKNHLAANLIDIGIVYMYQSDFPKCLEYYFKALKIYEELGDKLGIAKNLGNIGGVYNKQGNYPKALEYDFKALEMFEKLGSKNGIAINLGNIGSIYASQNNYPKALEYSFKALKISEELGSKNGIGSDLKTIGDVYESQGNYPKALEYTFKAVKIFEELGDKNRMGSTLGNIGECYLSIARDTVPVKSDSLIPAGKAACLHKAVEYAEKAIALCKETGDLDNLQGFYLDLAEAQALLGNYKEAFENHLQYSLYKDSVFSQQNNIKIANLETQRILDKQKEIDKLNVVKKRNERFFYIASIAMMLVVIVIVFRSYKTQRATNELLNTSNKLLSSEKQKSENLLLNILPVEVAEELKEKGTANARQFDDVSVLFTDFINFTAAGERMTPQQLVGELHDCFMAFDHIIGKYNIEKIKTVGDAYVAVSGMPLANPNHANEIVAAAREIRDYMLQRQQTHGDRTFGIRLGIHTGSVVAGIVGVKKFAYDIWGDTVNMASRMEDNSDPGRINISEATYDLVKDNYYCIHRGKIHVKNKGDIDMYFVE